MKTHLPTIIALLLAGVLFSLACDSKPTEPAASNPFDPDNPDPFNLVVVEEDGNIRLSWLEIKGPTLTGFTIFRRTDRGDQFARIDTADGDATDWIDPAPAYFTRSYYRIAAIGQSGAESDTAGRALDSIDVDPLFEIAGGSAVTRREIVLNLGAEGADSMVIWTGGPSDTINVDGVWEPFSETKPWTLESGFDTTFLFARLSRDGGEMSGTLAAPAAPARTEGSLELAGGDSLVARALMDVQLGGNVVTGIVLSEDMIFGNAGDDSLLFDLDDTLATPDTLISWSFNTDPVPKTLFARFANEFGVDTVVVDTVWPDSLRDIGIVLADGETSTALCVVPAALTANATLMNYTPGFPGDGWTAFDSAVTFSLPDTVAGDFIFEVLFSNDFFNSSPAPARDTITFAPIAMAVVITSPAPPETTITTVPDTLIDTTGVEPDTLISSHEDTTISYTTFTDGDSISVEGSNVAASCTARPDSVAVRIGSAAADKIKAVATWSFAGVIAESAGDTTLIDIIATATDEKDSTSADTVAVRILPSSAE